MPSLILAVLLAVQGAPAVLAPAPAEPPGLLAVRSELEGIQARQNRRIGELRREKERAAGRAKADRDKAESARRRTLGIDKETDEERRAREEAEVRAAEEARARARAARAAQRATSVWVDSPCEACAGQGIVDQRCGHCAGGGKEPYKTRKRSEREQQGAYWVVRTWEEHLTCMTCDGLGVVAAQCTVCGGDGILSREEGAK